MTKAARSGQLSTVGQWFVELGDAHHRRARALAATLRLQEAGAVALSTLRPRSAGFVPLQSWLTRHRQATTTRFAGRSLSFWHDGPLLEVHLHQPPCNEIGEAMLSELETLADHLRQGAGGARALLFVSDLPAGFSAGADLRALYSTLRAQAQEGLSAFHQLRALRRFLNRIHETFAVIDAVPLPTVAAIHGPCFGGGFELALTADLLVADRTARFCFPELRLGLVPGFGGIPRLRRDAGNALLRDLLFSGRSLHAARAHTLGLVSQIVAPGEAPAVARRLAAQTSRFQSEVVHHAKPFVKPIPWAELQREKELFVRLFATQRVDEALAAFVSRTDALPYLPEAPSGATPHPP